MATNRLNNFNRFNFKLSHRPINKYLTNLFFMNYLIELLSDSDQQVDFDWLAFRTIGIYVVISQFIIELVY